MVRPGDGVVIRGVKKKSAGTMKPLELHDTGTGFLYHYVSGREKAFF